MNRGSGSDAGQLGPWHLGFPLLQDELASICTARRSGDSGPLLGRVQRLADRLSAGVSLRGGVLRQAQVLSRVRHPGLLHVLGSGTDSGATWLATEHVDGLPLEDLITASGEHGALDVSVALRIVLDALDAVHALHGVAAPGARAVIHGDLCGRTILVGEDGVTRVSPSCLGTAVCSPEAPLCAYRLAHKAPEQLEALARRVDVRADVWAMGVVLWSTLLGRLPFAGATRAEIAGALAGMPVPALAALTARVPERVSDVVARALDRELAARPATIWALRDALAEAARGVVASREEVARAFAARLGRRMSRLRDEIDACFGLTSAAELQPVSSGDIVISLAPQAPPARPGSGDAPQPEEGDAMRVSSSELIPESHAASQPAPVTAMLPVEPAAGSAENERAADSDGTPSLPDLIAASQRSPRAPEEETAPLPLTVEKLAPLDAADDEDRETLPLHRPGSSTPPTISSVPPPLSAPETKRPKKKGRAPGALPPPASSLPPVAATATQSSPVAGRSVAAPPAQRSQWLWFVAAAALAVVGWATMTGSGGRVAPEPVAGSARAGAVAAASAPLLAAITPPPVPAQAGGSSVVAPPSAVPTMQSVPVAPSAAAAPLATASAPARPAPPRATGPVPQRAQPAPRPKPTPDPRVMDDI